MKKKTILVKEAGYPTPSFFFTFRTVPYHPYRLNRIQLPDLMTEVLGSLTVAGGSVPPALTDVDRLFCSEGRVVCRLDVWEGWRFSGWDVACCDWFWLGGREEAGGVERLGNKSAASSGSRISWLYTNSLEKKIDNESPILLQHLLFQAALWIRLRIRKYPNLFSGSDSGSE